MSLVGESLRAPIQARMRRLITHSRSLWSKLTAAILAKDMDRATEAKTAVEESQRESRRLREEGAEQYIPRFFSQNKEGRWIPKFVYVNVFIRFMVVAS